jgi:hypothetical protein
MTVYFFVYTEYSLEVCTSETQEIFVKKSRILLAKLLVAPAGNETPSPVVESKLLIRQNPGTLDLH